MVRFLESLLGGAASGFPSLSAKEGVILQLLITGGEMYGLQIVSASDGAVGRGTVYVTLARMEEKGFLESRPEEQPTGATGLPRRLYRVTGLGERALRAHELAAAVMSGKQVPT